MPGRVPQPRPQKSPSGARAELETKLGDQIVRFQDASVAVDDAAMAALALTRADLQCLTWLLSRGPRRRAELVAELGSRVGVLDATLERMELAGYVRRLAPEGSGGSRDRERLSITEHALAWVETIWTPIQKEGERLFARFSLEQLQVVSSLLAAATELQERHAARIGALSSTTAGAPRKRLRGTLSPAALQRVQVFIEANLHRPIGVADLARRAGLSEFHFARAFKKSMNTTPRALIELRRVERARALIGETDLPLATVAVDTGFQTQSRLTTAFRKATGLTPAVYRRGRRRT